MITIKEIIDPEFDAIINKFDDSVDFLKSKFNIELKTYGNLLRVGLNVIQPDSFNNLIERLIINRELERALENTGGYTIDVLEESNPKKKLIEILKYLQMNLLKSNHLYEYINMGSGRKTLVADLNDIDYFTQQFRYLRIKIISLTQLKRNINDFQNLVFYTFNGKKDFDFLYNCQQEIELLLYKQEHQLYKSQINRRKDQIESEILSVDRKLICGLSYEPIPELPIHISQTIDSIVNRIDGYGKKSYENYKEETDSLLDEVEDRIIYRVVMRNHNVEYFESNDTVYSSKGDLIKVYKINIGDGIRIYPREHFGEKLYQVAVDTDEEVFGKVEEHSRFWLDILRNLNSTDPHTLYLRLKSKGIRVLPGTVEAYFTGYRKFPMFNSDLKAMFMLNYPEKSELEIDLLLAPIRKSKSIYNSTMISLGRGIKQEIKLFLKDRRIGEILTKLKFTAPTLQSFIDEHMPLHYIVEKEVFNTDDGQLELDFNLQLDL